MKISDYFHFPILIRHHTSKQSTLYKLQESIFTYLLYFTYFLILASALGLSQMAPTYLSDLDYYVRVYVCLFLIWRFNPFSSIDQFTDLDRKIAYTAGVFILTTTVLNTYLKDAENYFLARFNAYRSSPREKETTDTTQQHQQTTTTTTKA